jgi:hypothetical protein
VKQFFIKIGNTKENDMYDKNIQILYEQEKQIKYLENKLKEIAKEFVFQAEKLAFYDKCGQIYYYCKKIIDKNK